MGATDDVTQLLFPVTFCHVRFMPPPFCKARGVRIKKSVRIISLRTVHVPDNNLNMEPQRRIKRREDVRTRTRIGRKSGNILQLFQNVVHFDKSPTCTLEDLRGVPGMRSPLGVQILSILCSFWENLAKPPSEK